MITWFAKNSVAANLLMLGIVAIGLFSMFKIVPLEVFPAFAKDEIRISMSLKGASPEDIEQSISIKIEEAINDLEGIKQIKSTSSEGKSTVKAEIESGYDLNELLNDIKSRVDAINGFPSEADNAVIEKTIHTREVIDVTLTSVYGEKELREYAQSLKTQLLQINGITQVELAGVRDFEMNVEISQATLLEYDLSITDVSTAINTSSMDLSAGNLKTSSGDILVRLKSQAYTKKDLAAIVIKKNIDGSALLLQDIAKITDGFEETALRARFNGKQAVFLDVYRIGNQSAIDVANKVKNFIKEKQEFLPKGYELSYWSDKSRIVKSRLNTLLDNAIQGSILIIILLTLFLRPAVALWVFIGIPVSFAGAFFVMPFFDITLNVLSLFAFILVLGIVVDDAIVTGENIYRHLGTSESGELAAINGTKEISVPVTFGVLTTVAAFAPLFFMEGNRSAIFTQIPYVVIPVLIFSLIESKLILPSHLKYVKLRHEKEKENSFDYYQRKFADGFEKSIIKYYKPVLALALKNKLSTILLFVSSLILIISLFIGGWSKFTFFPRVPGETVKVTLIMPTGTPFDVTNKHILYINKQAEILKKKYYNEEKQESIIKNILSVTGGRGGASNSGRVHFQITAPEDRALKISSAQLAKEWRKLIGTIKGAQSLEFRAEIGRSSSPIEVQLSGTSLSTLKEFSAKIKEHLKSYESVFDITDTLNNGKEEIRIELTKEGRYLGISKQEIASQVRQAFFGQEVQTIQRGKDEVSIMIRVPKNERQSLRDLDNLMLTTSANDKIPLSNLANLHIGSSPLSINRIDGLRTLNISADVEKENTNMTALKTDLKAYLEESVSQYPSINYTLEGEAREQEEAFNSLLYSLGFALLAIYILLAIPFKSYIQPLIVMSVIPFGVIGAVIGHWILGMNLTVLSLMGMLALTGIIVNDSLVLVDYINKQYKKTQDLTTAVLNAGIVRFRPVMLTSLTTFIGLLPLLFEKSTSAQFLIPMATSLAFGVLFATFTTLILVPVHYVLLDKFLKFVKN